MAPSSPPPADLPAETPAHPPVRSIWAGLAVSLGILADAALLALLIGISGFVFGAQEGANGEAGAVITWSLAVGICIISVILALVFWRRGKQGLGIAAAWLPPLGLALGALLVA